MAVVTSQSISLALHALALALLLILAARSYVTPMLPKPVLQVVPLTYRPRPVATAATHGGGSNTSTAPSRRGVPPPRSHRTFIPPATTLEPKLPVSASIDFDVPAMHVGLQNIGDPFASLAAGGFGKQGRGGIGNVPGCCGIGDDGGKPGLSGGIGQPTRPAELTYRVEPEFSEEARKAKFQGMVVLMIEIGVDGRAHNLKVVQPIGLGLDQKAIEAVAQWRFRPAQRGGKPLASTARVEVFFHLL